MKAKKAVVLVIGLAFSLIFCPAVWADGGVEPWPPSATPNPIILGTFTATYGEFDDNDKPTRFIIHAILENLQIIGDDPTMIRRQFWFTREVTDHSLPICLYANDELLKKYLKAPEAEKVATQFNLEGIPWLLDVKVLEKGDCDNEKGAFIKGSLIIQVKKPSQQ